MEEKPFVSSFLLHGALAVGLVIVMIHAHASGGSKGSTNKILHYCIPVYKYAMPSSAG